METITFKNFEELITEINNNLEAFASSFQEFRKGAKNGDRVSSKKKLFKYGKQGRNWAINSGGGTEIQYHIAFDDKTIKYGLGFNTQYVPFKTNDQKAFQMLKPFAKGFLKHISEFEKILPHYSLVHGRIENLQDPQNDQYTLWGKNIPYVKIGSGFELTKIDFENLLDDLEKQFEVYKVVFSFQKRYMETIKNESILNIQYILDKKGQIILQGPPGTGKTFLAKDLAEIILFGNISDDKHEQATKLEKSGRFKLVQFHPSYTYDDFVRGIQADPEDGSFRAVNKVFGEFCDLALKNYLQSKPDMANSLEVDKQEWLDDKIFEFSEHISEQIVQGTEQSLTEKAKIIEVNDRGFRYQGNWSNSSIIPYRDLKSMYVANNKNRQDVKYQNGLNRSAFYHATYYFYLLEKFRGFLNDKGYTFEEVEREVKDPDPYVFIIDEINRANLPSVLGELIYALEYRDKPVESMYALSNSGNALIIPSNLLIIGTMNTADRSVGHIDYAIRRRFAFVDVSPNEEVIKNVNKDQNTQIKALALFHTVSGLFVDKYLNSDFKPHEVQLGHSYFLAKNEATLALKLEYEIKPLLKEYIKDGILNENATDIVNSLSI